MRGSQTTNSFHGQIQFLTFGDFLTSNPFIVEFAAPFANENRFYIFNTLGFYGQDDWRVTSRLTLNLGLRYEFMTTARELQGKQSRLINDYTDAFTIGPVIGKQHRSTTSVRGSDLPTIRLVTARRPFAAESESTMTSEYWLPAWNRTPKVRLRFRRSSTLQSPR